MVEIPKLEIYRIIVLPSDEEKKIKNLEETLGKSILISFDNFAYTGELCKSQKDDFYIRYQTEKGIEERIIEINSTNVIFIKQS